MAVLRLYSRGGGAQDFEVLERVAPRDWETFKRTMIQYMKDRYQNPAHIERFEKMPFELWRGTNYFQDEFEVLCMKADMKAYVELENQMDANQPEGKPFFKHIAAIMDRLGRPVRHIAAELDMNGDIEHVPAPALAITTETVDAALRDAETLIKNHGPSSGVDRAHTALHGYLKAVCRKAGITFKEAASVTELFGRIRDEHPALRRARPETKQRVDNTLRGMAKIMDALDPIRNQNSLAHPNPVLLDDAEAMLAINLMRTMLNYFNDRIGAVTLDPP
jgi:hypothetical protein